MRRPAGGLGLLGVLLLLAACGDSAAGADGADGTASGAGAALAGRTFLSTDDVGIPGGGPLNLQFTDDGRLLASAGCNSANGPVDLSGGRLVAADLALTEMGCEPEVMAADAWLTDLLGAEPAWELADDATLVLTAGELVVSLTDRDVLQPPVELTGRQWDVDGLTDGETASSVPVGVAAFLRIDGDALTGHTGCNELTGTVTIDGDTLTVRDLVTTDVACDGAAGYVEDVVLEALAGDVRFSITGNRLSLEAPSGFGLEAVSTR
ncbi:META domain-containing protein [Jiangella rhizosphaerae]|uniref:META domain-containing protein n=1 Tax=Jiangella rhizosphaerae TaxID=2293569 RepID=A0A418KMA9_9ACTN|nr:META domain-containing protein [Jiangella rhizosphaerae]RIQ19500.1 META domain-containing protein [Jiangella rhizosphaerae]